MFSPRTCHRQVMWISYVVYFCILGNPIISIEGRLSILSMQSIVSRLNVCIQSVTPDSPAKNQLCTSCTTAPPCEDQWCCKLKLPTGTETGSWWTTICDTGQFSYMSLHVGRTMILSHAHNLGLISTNDEHWLPLNFCSTCKSQISL